MSPEIGKTDFVLNYYQLLLVLNFFIMVLININVENSLDWLFNIFNLFYSFLMQLIFV